MEIETDLKLPMYTDTGREVYRSMPYDQVYEPIWEVQSDEVSLEMLRMMFVSILKTFLMSLVLLV